MKKIEDFIKKNNSEIVSMTTVFGGNDPNRVNTFKQKTEQCGNHCQVATTTDHYSDTNGNNHWDPGESGSSTLYLENCSNNAPAITAN